MKFTHRLAYFLGGFSMGILILIFFLSGKRTSCDYFPDARVLKDIREKQRIYSEDAIEKLKNKKIDTAEITSMLYSGDVDFSRSNTNLECNLYLITGRAADQRFVELLIENCDSVATLMEVTVLPKNLK